jgi:predicted anti-sigma-YlaC factor YlaD
MHEVIEKGLEDYLGGQVRRDFQAHLAECENCRAEVRQFEELSGMFSALREPEAIQPDPGFYFRVTQAIEARQQPSIWSLFSLDAVFGRRVAFGSLMTLAIVGSLLLSTESNVEIPGQNEPVQAMASHDFSISHESGVDRDHMLVTLASYQER